MTDRATALTRATAWAEQAEACDRERRTSLAKSRDYATSDYTLKLAREARETADAAEVSRQRAVEMARMWTGIARVAGQGGAL